MSTTMLRPTIPKTVIPNVAKDDELNYQQKTLSNAERVCELVGEILCGAHDVACLKTLRAF